PVWLQASRRPNALDRGVAHAGHRRQRPGAPLGRTFRLGLRGQTHDLGWVDLGLASAARQILLNGSQSADGVALTPASCLDPTNAEHLADSVIVQSVRREQHDAGASRQTHFRGIRMRQLHQLLPLRIVQFNATCLSHRRLQSASYTPRSRSNLNSSTKYEALHYDAQR